jgi:hypothetical protein
MQVIAGLGLVVASVLGFWIALPRDGHVRGFLRSDHIQAYYTVTLLGAFVIGVLNLGLGLKAVIG